MTGRSMRCRALLAVTTIAVLGSCAGDVSDAPGTPEGSSGGGRPTMDPCTVLSDAELAQLGRQPETRRTVRELDAIGCGWRGQPFGLTLTTNPDTIADYRERRDDPVFVTFMENQVNDRRGVQTQVAISGEECAQAVGTGSGVLSVGVRLSARASVDGVQADPCVEALRIAELIEPRIPEAGS